MKYLQLPSTIYENGMLYCLVSQKFDEHGGMMDGWWSFQYIGNDDFPVEATDGGSIYYLISVEETKEEAEKSLLDKLNSAKEILTEERKAEIMKKWKDKLNKQKKNGN
jgi:hypothetical protein